MDRAPARALKIVIVTNVKNSGVQLSPIAPPGRFWTVHKPDYAAGVSAVAYVINLRQRRIVKDAYIINVISAGFLLDWQSRPLIISFLCKYRLGGGC